MGHVSVLHQAMGDGVGGDDCRVRKQCVVRLHGEAGRHQVIGTGERLPWSERDQWYVNVELDQDPARILERWQLMTRFGKAQVEVALLQQRGLKLPSAFTRYEHVDVARHAGADTKNAHTAESSMLEEQAGNPRSGGSPE